jgi:hypothetical protein
MAQEKELQATCNGCGFQGHPDEFDPCMSPYHDLHCRKCGTTNVDWTYGDYKDNSLVPRGQGE